LSLALFPLFVTVNMIPKIALGPLIIVWLGYGLGPNIVTTFAISFFPVLLKRCED
jgi:NitT/TauT family transport system permease protein